MTKLVPSVEAIRRSEQDHRPVRSINVGEVERSVSTVAGTLLVLIGLKRRSTSGLALATLGGGLLYRGVSGQCPAYSALHIDTAGKQPSDRAQHIHHGQLVKHSLTVNRPASDLYAYWRDVENAPRFMERIVSVRKLDATKSSWEAEGPFGARLAWESEIIADQADHLIAWKTLPGGAIHQAGTVRFEPAAGGRGTVVTVEMNYEPPGGVLGVAVAKLLGSDPDRLTLENIRRFKSLMEAGEIPTVQGQPSGRA